MPTKCKATYDKRTCVVSIAHSVHQDVTGYTWTGGEAMLCEHANENPNICYCPSECYCRRVGNTCYEKANNRRAWHSSHDPQKEMLNEKPQFDERQPSNIDHPQHYGGDTTYEAIKVIEAWRLPFTLGNCVKYICRAGKKGSALEDLKKAAWYLDYEIKQLGESDKVMIDKGTTIKVLDHGYVKFVESWGSDAGIIEAARMSTDKGFLGWEAQWTYVCPNKCYSCTLQEQHAGWTLLSHAGAGRPSQLAEVSDVTGSSKSAA